MSQVSRERNLHFFGYLQSIGIFDEEQFDTIADKCSQSDEKQTLFQISNFFANFTASDWFDLTCRMYNNYQRLPNQSQDLPYSPVIQQNPPQSSQTVRSGNTEQGHIRKNNSIISQENSETARTVDKRAQNNSRGETKQWEPSQKQQRVDQEDPKYQTPSKSGNSTRRNQDNEGNGKTSNRTPSYGENKRSVSPNENKTVTPRKTPTPTRTQNRQQQASSSAAATDETYNRLYNDFFQKRATMEYKREMKKSAELDECTFVPQVNPVDEENHALKSSLRVPVYDRLLQAKQIPANLILEKQEYKELKGATFQPDISKSQKNNKWSPYQLGSPEDRKREAVERLYEDAQIKEKIMFIKQMSRKEQEFEGCTFSPKVLSPQKDKDSFIKRDLTKSVDRLYDENLRRHRKLLKKEVEVREQEMEECTFQPDRQARNYRSKESDLDDLEVHDRLYERFKKKQHESAVSEANYASNQSHRAKSSTRANSAMLEKVSKSPNPRGFVTEAPDVNTPAFDRLYKDMIKRKMKMNELQDKFDKEDGLTFKPKTNNSRKNKRSGSGTNRSHQDIRLNSLYDSKYSEGLLHETPYDNRRESDQQFYASTMGFTYDRSGFSSNPNRRIKN